MVVAGERTNRLLSVLSHESRELLLTRATAVSVPAKMVFHEENNAPLYGWLLTSGLASTVALTPGATAGSGCIGREGVVGALHLLGPACLPTRCSMELAGTAFRLPFSALQQAFWSSAEIRGRMLELIQVEVATLQLSAVCHLEHGAEMRLASHLLVVQDRTQEPALNLTQEMLAKALGTTRSTVSLIAVAFQKRGLITYSRGQVRIVDRDGLETAACGCYPIHRKLHRSLYRQPVPASELQAGL